MTPRDLMLKNIRAAVGQPSKAAAGVPSPALPANSDPGPQALQFTENLTALGCQVLQVSSIAEARAHAEKIVDGRSFIASPAEIVRGCGFATPFSRELCSTAGFGITSADFALADTGSLVFLSKSGESRLISLLPPRHLAIIEESKILPDIAGLFARLPCPAAESSSMVIVTGPSRTADIEMRLVRGVHGPGEVTVIVVNNM